MAIGRFNRVTMQKRLKYKIDLKQLEEKEN